MWLGLISLVRRYSVVTVTGGNITSISKHVNKCVSKREFYDSNMLGFIFC